MVPEGHQNYRAGAYGDDVAECRGELGTKNPGNVEEQLVVAHRATRIVNDPSEGGAGHGRLLGGESKVVILHENEADRVIEADKKPLDEQRETQVRGDELDCGGADGEQSATHG